MPPTMSLFRLAELVRTAKQERGSETNAPCSSAWCPNGARQHSSQRRLLGTQLRCRQLEDHQGVLFGQRDAAGDKLHRDGSA